MTDPNPSQQTAHKNGHICLFRPSLHKNYLTGHQSNSQVVKEWFGNGLSERNPSLWQSFSNWKEVL